ncbi:MAG: hypothetical protein NC124_02205 [Clostridium sp.]|nr:hypothetical protein [Clostridium sp.]
MENTTLYTVIAFILTAILSLPFMNKALKSKYAKVVDKAVELLNECRVALSDGALSEEEVKAIKLKIDEFISSFKE